VHTYLWVLLGCLAGAVWLDPVLRLGVLRQGGRLLRAILPVALIFVAWDLAAIAAGHRDFDAHQLIGVWLPGDLPVEELMFFMIVPVCAILAYEAVRQTLDRTGRPRP
jgi:lycopene cyclase domain-containing protein